MQEQSTAGAPALAETADFGTRFVAGLIDAIIIGVPMFIVSLILPMPLSNLLGLVAGISYQVYFWTTTGQTLGKTAMGLKVVSAETGELLDIGGAALRYVGYIVSSIPLGLGFFWILWDPNREGWHDKIAKTRVIKVAK